MVFSWRVCCFADLWIGRKPIQKNQFYDEKTMNTIMEYIKVRYSFYHSVHDLEGLCVAANEDCRLFSCGVEVRVQRIVCCIQVWFPLARFLSSLADACVRRFCWNLIFLIRLASFTCSAALPSLMRIWNSSPASRSSSIRSIFLMWTTSVMAIATSSWRATPLSRLSHWRTFTTSRLRYALIDLYFCADS